MKHKSRDVGCRRGIRIPFRLFFFSPSGNIAGMTSGLMSYVNGSNEQNNERYEARIYKDRRSNGTERKGERDIAACDRLAMISGYGL